jgi:gas vesicle protein
MSYGSEDGYFRGLVTGLLFGAAAALLLAPKRGGELRGEIASGTGRLKERAGELGIGAVESASHAAHELKERGGEVLTNAKDTVTGGVEKVQDALAGSVDHAEKIAAEVRDEAANATEETADKADDAKGKAKDKMHDVVESV